MVDKSYVPDRGDIVWLSLNPSIGREQKGRRPAVVISPKYYNSKVGLALLCPMTSQKKGYPFEVEIETKKIQGVVLADQIRAIDWKIRKTKLVTRVDSETLNEILAKIEPLVS